MTRASTVLRRESRIVHELDGIARLRSSREAIPSFRYGAQVVLDRLRTDEERGRSFPGRPNLPRLLAASDVALVQGGLTTTMELVALGRPFVAFPLRNHFEQRLHVRHQRRAASLPAGRDRRRRAGRGAHGRASLNRRCRSS